MIAKLQDFDLFKFVPMSSECLLISFQREHSSTEREEEEEEEDNQGERILIQGENLGSTIWGKFPKNSRLKFRI